jgi:hypothetical protein
MNNYEHELDDPQTDFQFRIFAELDLKDKSIIETVEYVGELWKQLYKANEVQRKIIQGRWDNYVEEVLKEATSLRDVS